MFHSAAFFFFSSSLETKPQGSGQQPQPQPGFLVAPESVLSFWGGESRRLRLKKKKHTAAHPLSFRPHFFYYFLSFPFLSFAGPASTVSTAPPTGGGREIRKGRVTWWARDYYDEEEEEDEADITRVYIYI